LLSTGRITLPVAAPERECLMQVRRGEVSLRRVLDRLHDESARLEDTILGSGLAELLKAPRRAVGVTVRSELREAVLPKR